MGVVESQRTTPWWVCVCLRQAMEFVTAARVGWCGYVLQQQSACLWWLLRSLEAVYENVSTSTDCGDLVIVASVLGAPITTKPRRLYPVAGTQQTATYILAPAAAPPEDAM